MKHFFLIFFFSSYFTYAYELEDIKKHIDKRFEDSIVETDPFPCIVIHNVLPSSYYEELSKMYPSPSSFAQKDGWRKRIAVTFSSEKELSQLTPEEREVWLPFGETVVNHYIKENLLRAFLPYLPYKFPDADLSQLEYVYQNIKCVNNHFDGISQDVPGYSIGPHIDPAYVFTAFLIYMPEDEDHLNRGTSLFESKDKKFLSMDKSFLQRRQCKVAKRLPFAPNTLVAFLQTPSSWHGVDRVNDPTYIRRTYHGNINLHNTSVKDFYGSFVLFDEDLPEDEPNKYVRIYD